MTPSGFFVLRTPLLPHDTLRRWAGDLAASAALDRDAGDAELAAALAADRLRLRQGIAERLADPAVRDAIHVASPDLTAALHYWTEDPDGERGQRVERSLVRYLSRMVSRPTPFGLFAGTSVGVLSADTNLEVAPRAEYGRLTRLDTGYLSRLTIALTAHPEVAGRLRYRPNDTLYRSAGRWRYVEWRPDTATETSNPFHERTHHLVAIDDSAAVRATIDRASIERGATAHDLASALVSESITLERAGGFVQTLIDNQVLLPDLTVPVTGELPLPAIERSLRSYDADSVAEQLREVREALATIDAARVGVAPRRYDDVAKMLEAFPAKIDRGQLFHVDLSKPAPRARLGHAVTRELANAAELMRRIGRWSDGALARFRAAFTARYETRSVPLLEVLDEEMGIGFPVRVEGRSDAEALLAGIVFPSRSEMDVVWGSREARLLRLLTNAATGSRQEIDLTPRDLDALESSDGMPLPDAFAVMATVVASSNDALRRGDFRVVVSNANGPSGAQLLGRFCHGDAMLCEHVRRHLRAEEAIDPEAIHAELVHVAHPRAGNIVGRPVLREFEISYMGRSGAPADRQIPASDLLVSVEDGRIVLRSATHGKRVVVRLASAHNLTSKAVAAYRFLGALQNQDAAPAAWSWGPLGEAPFLPRVRHGRLILSLARWRVPKEELEELGRKSGADLMRAVRRWRADRGLPRRVTVADADNALLVDLDNVLSVESFVQLVRRREVALLDEVYPSDDALCAYGPEGAFAHELIVPFVRATEAPVPSPRPPRTGRGVAVTRRLTPGSEWVYAKVYTGAPAADRVLTSAIAPLVGRALEEGWIDRWFFIRYADPDPHLRVRFHGDANVMHTHLVPALHAVVAAETQTGRVWRTQLDTYEREVERYGGPEGMLLSERIFQIDSDAAVSLAELSVRGRLPAADRWRVALVGAECLIADLGLAAADRRMLVESLRDGYRREQKLEPPYVRQISERFRTERASLAAMFAAMDGDASAVGRGVIAALDVLRLRSARLAPIANELRALSNEGTLDVALPDLVGSHVHMSLVRQLRSSVRQQEAVIYDFLARLYADPRFESRRA